MQDVSKGDHETHLRFFVALASLERTSFTCRMQKAALPHVLSTPRFNNISFAFPLLPSLLTFR